MHSAATERLEFAPPPVKGSLRALMLALLVHLLLVAALTWGVHWKQAEEQAGSFEAELWTGTAQQSTPESLKPTPPVPEAKPLPTPVPPAVQAPEVKEAPVQPHVDIALEKEKERQQAKKLQARQQAELQAQQALAQRKVTEKAAQAEKATEQKQQAKALEKEKLAAAAAAEKRHQEAVKRMIGMAGATTAGTAAGSGAGASKGPSADYASKVVARVLPNVVFTDEITGSPQAEVEVRSTADGTIMSQRLVKSSGNPAWDDAVLKAIVRTGSLPRDTDGRVPTPMIIAFRPN